MTDHAAPQKDSTHLFGRAPRPHLDVRSTDADVAELTEHFTPRVPQGYRVHAGDTAG